MTIFNALLFLVGFFEFAMCIVILRAAPERYDNRVFAAMGLIEGGLQVFRGFSVMEGHELLGRVCLQGDMLATIPMGYLTSGSRTVPVQPAPSPAFWSRPLWTAAFALSAHPDTFMWFARSTWLFGPARDHDLAPVPQHPAPHAARSVGIHLSCRPRSAGASRCSRSSPPGVGRPSSRCWSTSTRRER
jgi:hypothetical protein